MLEQVARVAVAIGAWVRARPAVAKLGALCEVVRRRDLSRQERREVGVPLQVETRSRAAELRVHTPRPVVTGIAECTSFCVSLSVAATRKVARVIDCYDWVGPAV